MPTEPAAVEVPLVPGAAGEGGVGATGRRRVSPSDGRGIEVAQVDHRKPAVVSGGVGEVAVSFVHAGDRVGAVVHGHPRADVWVARVGDVDDEQFATAGVDVLDVGTAGLVEVGTDQDEPFDHLTSGASFAVRHGFVLEHEVVDGPGQAGARRVGGVEDADAVEAGGVEVRAGPGERGRDHPALVGHRGDEPDAGAGDQWYREALLAGWPDRSAGSGDPGGKDEGNGAHQGQRYAPPTVAAYSCHV